MCCTNNTGSQCSTKYFEFSTIIDQHGVQPIEKLIQTVGVILDQWNNDIILSGELKEECQAMKEKLLIVQLK